MKKVSIYFDGGCNPNPGEGYGSYDIVCSEDPSINCSVRRMSFGGAMTSNKAEYYSLLSALEWLSSWPGSRSGLGDMDISVFTDSKLLLNQVYGRWRIKKPHLKPLSNQVLVVLSLFGKWSINWHRREHNVKRFGH